MSTNSEAKDWACQICGWVYEEAKGDPVGEIAPGTKWVDLPDNWVCPECGSCQEEFEPDQG